MKNLVALIQVHLRLYRIKRLRKYWIKRKYNPIILTTVEQKKKAWS